MTVAVVGATVATTLLSSYSSRAASRAAEDTLSQLEEQVCTITAQALDTVTRTPIHAPLKTARCQGLLETAMPPIIAKELLAGTSDEALAASLDSVAIAFITLSDFDAVTARLPPKQLMQVCGWYADALTFRGVLEPTSVGSWCSG